MNPIDMILDDDCTENIILYNEDNQPVEMEQIAVMNIDDVIYVILRPLEEGVLAEDEALVFSLTEGEEESSLELCEDEAIVDLVFEEYYKMLREAGADV